MAVKEVSVWNIYQKNQWEAFEYNFSWKHIEIPKLHNVLMCVPVCGGEWNKTVSGQGKTIRRSEILSDEVLV